MNLKKRVLSLILSAAMLLSPLGVLAEDSAYAFSAGDMTATMLEESYAIGEQINLTAALDIVPAESMADKKADALAALLDKCRVQMSFYDDFGTDRIHAELLMEDTSLVSANVLVLEDGSVQMMTSLTGKYVMTLPAGTLVDGKLHLQSDVELSDVDILSEEFKALPLEDRLRLSMNDLGISLISMLLGWVSQTQMDRGDLYLTDNTYLEATQTRDAVAQRLVGTISNIDFIHLFWNITTTLRDNHGAVRQALADLLAEMGVTRYQVHQLADRLFTKQTIDPAVDWTQPSTNILDDGALCTQDDIRYVVVKLQKCVDNLWREVIIQDMSMIVSYDDFGQVVGFDATVPQICNSLPYEGDFQYSIKTDDNWQRMHTSHGELQIYNDNRIVGDLDMQFGEDVDGVNASHVKGYLDIRNQKDGSLSGLGMDAALTFSKGTDDFGETELFEGNAALKLRRDTEETSVLSAAVSGLTAETEAGFSIDATAMLDAAGIAQAVVDLRVESAEAEDIPFAGGIAIDLLSISDEQIQSLKSEVMTQAMGLSMSLLTKPDVLANLMTLVGE